MSDASDARVSEALGEQVAAVLDVDDAIIDGEVIVADETGRPTSSGLTAPTNALCRSTSAADGCRAFCRRDRRSFPRRIRRGEGARTVRADVYDCGRFHRCGSDGWIADLRHPMAMP